MIENFKRNKKVEKNFEYMSKIMIPTKLTNEKRK